MVNRLFFLSFSLLGAAIGQDYNQVGKYELGVFGGGQFFGQKDNAPRLKLVNGGTYGFRITQNYWRLFSVEEMFRLHGTNNARFDVPGTNRTVDLGARSRGFSVGPVYHFTPRESVIRPFVKVALGLNWFLPTDNARSQAMAPASPLGQQVDLRRDLGAAFEFGGGVKARVHPRVGLRLDAGGVVMGAPHLNIPTSGPAGAVVVPDPGGSVTGAQLTGGLSFYLGELEAAAVPGSFSAGEIAPAAITAYQGERVTFRVPASTTYDGVKPAWRWMLDGQPTRGDGDTLTLVAPAPGEHEVRAMVEADTSGVTRGNVRRFLRANPIPAAARTGKLIVREWPKPSISFSAPPAELTGKGGSATVGAKVDPLDRTRDLTYIFRATEGRLAPGETAGGEVSQPDPQTVIVTVKGVKPGETPNVTAIFTPEGIDLAPGTSRTVTITATAKDNTGAESTATTEIRLSEPASAPAPAPATRPSAAPAPPPSLQPIQLDDILFSAGGSRVNNCGKRVLDQAYERASANGDYEVVLVGHVDAREMPRSKKSRRRAAAIDRARVIQAAAYLTNGTGVCKRLELSRVKMVQAGTEQSNPFKTLMCAGSTGKTRGRAADARAKNRRVEVWLIPRAGAGVRPAGLNPRVIPASVMPRSCPD